MRARRVLTREWQMEQAHACIDGKTCALAYGGACGRGTQVQAAGGGVKCDVMRPAYACALQAVFSMHALGLEFLSPPLPSTSTHCFS